MQVRDTLRLLLIAAMLACLPAAPSEAQIIGLSEHEIDLTIKRLALEILPSIPFLPDFQHC